MPTAPPLPDLLPVFNALPGANLLLTPNLRIVAASDDYLTATLTQRATLVGQFIFDAFPDNPQTPEANAVARVRASLQQVLATKQPHEMAPQHYDVPDPAQPGRFVERHWWPRHTPVLDAQGQVQFLIQSVQDVTARHLAERQLRESQAGEQAARAEFRHFIEQAPVAVAVYHGPEFRVELANATTLGIWGRPQEAVLGRPVFEVLPEAATPDIVALFERVYTTGTPHTAHEQPSTIFRSGQPEVVYWNTVFEPQRAPDGRISGLFTVGIDVTEQVRARQRVEQLNQELETRVQARTAQLRQQQGLLQQILGQVPAAIGTLSGPEHRYTFFNERYLAMSTGRLQLGRSVAEAHPEVVAQGVVGLLDNVYATGQAFSATEMAVQLHDNATDRLEQRYLDYLYQPLTDGQGQTTNILVFVLDVTEKVRTRQQTEALQADLLTTAQRQVQERATLYQVFEETQAVVALLRSPGHRYEYVNPAYQALFSGRPLVGLDVAVAVPEMLKQGFVAVLDRVYQSGETYLGEEVPFAVVPPGEAPRTRYFNFTMQAYREAGTIAGISVFAFDVTEQVLARQEREAQRQQLYALFSQAPAAICILGGEHLVYELVNPSYQELFPGRQFLGRPLLDALPEIAGHAVHRGFREVYETGTSQEAKALLIPLARPDDGVLEDRYFNYIQQARRNARGQPDGILVFAFEVTEQVRARQQAQTLAAELTKANDQLTRTNVDLDNFIYTASHDLKAPISNLEGLLYLLQQELPADVQAGEFVAPTLTRMLDAIERFKRTIDHLTEVSKLQQAHAPVTLPFDLALVVEDVCLDLAPLLRETNAQLLVNVAASPPVLFAEKNLRSVVYNLLSNALKYRHPDRRPHVDVRTHVRPGTTVLEVHDNGLGLAPHQLPNLFGMFQRFHDHVEGTGIGLYMVKRMVENAGGRLEVHSQLGAGTTFFVHFPHTPA